MNEHYDVCPFCMLAPCEFFIGNLCSNMAAFKAVPKRVKNVPPKANPFDQPIDWVKQWDIAVKIDENEPFGAIR